MSNGTTAMPAIPQADPKKDYAGRTVVYMPKHSMPGLPTSGEHSAAAAVQFLVEQGMVQAPPAVKQAPQDPSIACYLPEGWTTVKYLRDVHIYWGTPYDGRGGDYMILDAQGRVRVDCRHAFTFVRYIDWVVFVKLMPRFAIQEESDFDNDTVMVYVTDGGRDLHAFSETREFANSQYGAVRDELVARARVWLDERYPEWESVRSYWDE